MLVHRSKDLAARVVAGTVALALVWPRAVHAADETTVATLPLRVEGELDDAQRHELASAISAGLERAGVSARALPSVPTPCDAACMVAQARTAGVGTILGVEVRVVERNYAITLRVIDGRTGEARARAEATCELCGTAEVATLLGDQIGTLAPKLVPTDPELARLHLRSDPSGANVRVDGDARGTTPVWLELTPGTHRLRLERRGHVSIERDAFAVAGVDEQLSVTLPAERRRSRVAGAIVLGLGLALAGTGAGLLAIDERPYRRRCSGDDRDFSGRCRFRYDTLTPGAVVVSVGAAAVITGIILLARRRRS